MSDNMPFWYVPFIVASLLMIGGLLSLLPLMVTFPTQYLPVGYVLTPIGVAIFVFALVYFYRNVAKNL